MRIKTSQTTTKTKEQDVVRGILELLALYKLKPIHVRNTGNIYMDRDGNRRFGKTADGQKGAPDIVFSFLGRAVALEVKSSVGKQSPDQKTWEQSWFAMPSNGYYFLVRTIESVQNILENLKKKHGN